MSDYITRRNKRDLEIFERMLNSYIETDIFKDKCCTCCNCTCFDFGTMLKEEDYNKFREYFDLWVEEASNTKIVSKTRSSNILKKYKWSKNCTEEELYTIGVQAQRTIGVV